MLEFGILGPLEVVGPEGPLALGGRKQRATLAILLLDANRVVSMDRLADELYAGRAPVTAATQVHRQISELRKALGEDAKLETRSPGYVIRVAPGQLDLQRFERLTEDAGHALARGEAEEAFELQRDALALWRGPVLADLDDDPFAQNARRRLQEIQLAALEQRVDAELVLGRHRELVGELDGLVGEHPFHEPLTLRLMLALYRCGRQADALYAYRRTREKLVEAFGIEPGRELRELERSILNQAPALDVGVGVVTPVAASDRIVLVLPSGDEHLDALLTVAEPLASLPGRALLIARLLPDEVLVSSTAAALNVRRASIGVEARTATFTTVDPVDDALRLATAHDVQLVLLDAQGLDADELPGYLTSLVERSPADVGALHGTPSRLDSSSAIFVPFGGGEHDWAALEVSGWLGVATGARLRLVGTKADPAGGRRDSTRLLADASLAVQRVVGVDTEPILAEMSVEALVDAVRPAALVVMGISPRWRHDGISSTCRALLGHSTAVLLVHRGPRPGGLAPRETRTRFTWSL